MTNQVIPDEAVEAAAKVYNSKCFDVAWETLPDWARTSRMEDALEILEVAAPHIRAQALEDAAAEVDEGVPAHGQEQYAGWLRTRAEQIRPTP